MSYIIGIDEVGRGSLAGPVMVAAALIPTNWKLDKKKIKIPLRDSKKLPVRQRIEWLQHCKADPEIRYEVAKVGSKLIDRINISNAANSAALKACTRLIRKSGIPLKEVKVYLDGSLYLGKKNKKHAYASKTIIKGDETIPAISIASIIAKVHRDRFMEKLSKKYSGYGLDTHKGYGTKMHRAQIKKLGPSEIHRLTFL